SEQPSQAEPGKTGSGWPGCRRHMRLWTFLGGFAQLLPQSPEYPRLRHPNGAGAHLQLDRNLLGSSVLDRGEPECPPGALLELAADQLEGSTDQAAISANLAGVIGIGDLRCGKPREPDLGVRPSGTSRFPSRPPVVIAHLVPRDRPEPAAKRVPFPLP